MNHLEITDLGFGIKAIKRQPLGDERGSLTRLFCADELASAGWTKPIVQINGVENKFRGTVRGLHYQAASFAESKILLCMQGEINDVVVDIRKGSKTFLQHVSVRLSGAKGNGILIPAGFAHGYQCLTDDVSLLYFHDAHHAPEAERGLNVRDPRLKIAWPLPVENLSKRDMGHDFIDDKFEGEVV